MKIIPKSKEEKQKDQVTLYRNCLKAGLSPVSEDIFTDGEEYFRLSDIPRKVSDIKKIIDDRYAGNKNSFSVQMHDFESIIPDDILCVLINRRVEALLKRRVKEEMSAIGLSTSIPENVYDPDRDGPKNFSFDEEFSTDRTLSFYDSYFTQDDENGY